MLAPQVISYKVPPKERNSLRISLGRLCQGQVTCCPPGLLDPWSGICKATLTSWNFPLLVSVLPSKAVSSYMCLLLLLSAQDLQSNPVPHSCPSPPGPAGQTEIQLLLLHHGSESSHLLKHAPVHPGTCSHVYTLTHSH